MARGPLGSPSYLPHPCLAERTLSPKPVWGPAHWLRQATWRADSGQVWARLSCLPPPRPPWGQEPSLTPCVVTASLTVCGLACRASSLSESGHPAPGSGLALGRRSRAPHGVQCWTGGASVGGYSPKGFLEGSEAGPALGGSSCTAGPARGPAGARSGARPGSASCLQPGKVGLSGAAPVGTQAEQWSPENKQY